MKTKTNTKKQSVLGGNTQGNKGKQGEKGTRQPSDPRNNKGVPGVGVRNPTPMKTKTPLETNERTNESQIANRAQ